MSARVRKTHRAEKDIHRIAHQISRDSLTAAVNWLDELDQKLKIIGESPGIGTERSDLRRRIRSYAFGNYLIFFKPTKTVVVILRVIHGARDYKRLFE